MRSFKLASNFQVSLQSLVLSIATTISTMQPQLSMKGDWRECTTNTTCQTMVFSMKIAISRPGQQHPSSSFMVSTLVSIFVKTSGILQDHSHDKPTQVRKLSSISMVPLITLGKAPYV